MSAVPSQTAQDPHLFQLLLDAKCLEISPLVIKDDQIVGGGFKIEDSRFCPYQITLPSDKLYSGQLLSKIGDLFAQKINQLGFKPEVILSCDSDNGHLATATICSLSKLFQTQCVTVSLTNKDGDLEISDKFPMKGKKTVIIDTYVLKGSKMLDAIRLIQSAKAVLEGVVTFFDHQAIRDINTPFSAFQCLRMWNVSVGSTLSVIDLQTFFGRAKIDGKEKFLKELALYRNVWREQNDLSRAMPKK